MRALLRRSLSLRLLAIFALTGVAALAVLVLVLREGLSGQWRRAMQPHLQRYVEYTLDDLGQPPSLARARAIADAVPVEIALYRGDEFLWATDGRRLPLDSLRFGTPGARRHGADHAPPGRPGGPRGVAVSGDRLGPILRVRRGGLDVYFRLDTRSRARGYAAELGLAALALGLVLLGSWLAIRRQLRPVGRVAAAVERMRAGDLEARTGLVGDDDLATLGASVDAMAARLAAMLDAKRELLLAVSHELRSPIARARVALELLAPGTARERLRADLVEMQTLVDALLESERLSARHAVLSLGEVDLAALVRDVVAGARAGHVGAGVGAGVGTGAGAATFALRLPGGPVPIVADEARLRVLVRNLVGNAALHGRDADGAATVDIRLDADARHCELRVSDAGPGVPAAQREAVTEAFERLDASRSRRTGGVGLGLSLARRIAEAHGGTLALSDARPHGLVVTVRLPRDPARTDALDSRT